MTHVYRLDMSMMLAVHGALRRDLESIARITAPGGDDPRRILAAALGWDLFKQYLHVHHTTEDDVLWPPMERKLADRPDEMALMQAMEAEHAAIDPVISAVDAALADPEHGPQALPGLTDELVTVLGGHLRHEEKDALEVIDVTLEESEWATFGAEHRARVGTSAPTYLPWVLDGGDPALVQDILGHMPPPLVQNYRTQWKAAFEGLDRWAPRLEPAAHP